MDFTLQMLTYLPLGGVECFEVVASYEVLVLLKIMDDLEYNCTGEFPGGWWIN